MPTIDYSVTIQNTKKTVLYYHENKRNVTVDNVMETGLSLREYFGRWAKIQIKPENAEVYTLDENGYPIDD